MATAKPKVPPMDAVLEREIRFVAEYVKDFQTTRAYRAAYSTDAPSAHVGGYKLLRRKRVKLMIRQKLAELARFQTFDAIRIRKEFEILAVSAPRTRERIRALENLAKATPGFYEPEEHDVTVRTDEERRARIAEIISKAQAAKAGSTT